MVWELSKVAAILELPTAAVAGVLLKPVGLAVTTIPICYGVARLTTPVPSPLLLAFEMAACGSLYAATLYWADGDVARDAGKMWSSFRKPVAMTS
jgi:hypothetical protein